MTGKAEEWRQTKDDGSHDEHWVFYWKRRVLRCDDCKVELAVDHECWENAVLYQSDGPLGHGWECDRCGVFLQAG